MATIGNLAVKLKLDTTGFTGPIIAAQAKASALMRAVAADQKKIAAQQGTLSQQFKIRPTIAGAGVAAVGASIGAIKLAAEMEKTAISFEVMIGNARRAKGVLEELRAFADKTPFEFPELATAGKSLIAFGFDAQETVPLLKRLGDVSSGLAVPIGEIAQVYGKARVQGRAFARDIHELTNRGVPIIQELAKQFHVADDNVMKLVEDGKVGFKNIETAFISLTSEGGKFAGLTDRLSESFAGKFSTAADRLKTIGVLFGDAAIEALRLKSALDEAAGIDVRKSGVDLAAERRFANKFAAFQADKKNAPLINGATPEMMERWKDIDELTKKLREQAEAFGLSNRELVANQLATLRATEGEKKLALSFVDMQAAAEKQKHLAETMAEYATQLERAGMAADDLKRLEFADMGASPADLERIKGQQADAAKQIEKADAVERGKQEQLDLKEEGKRVISDMMSPAAKLSEQLAHLAKIRDAGGFGDPNSPEANAVFDRARLRATKDFEGTLGESPSEISAVKVGSKESYSLMHNFMSQGKDRDTKEVLEIAKRQLIEEQKMNRILAVKPPIANFPR